MDLGQRDKGECRLRELAVPWESPAPEEGVLDEGREGA